MNCETCTYPVADYVAGALSDEERIVFERELVHCDTCRAELAHQRNLVEVFGSERSLALSPARRDALFALAADEVKGVGSAELREADGGRSSQLLWLLPAAAVFAAAFAWLLLPTLRGGASEERFNESAEQMASLDEQSIPHSMAPSGASAPEAAPRAPSFADEMVEEAEAEAEMAALPEREADGAALGGRHMRGPSVVSGRSMNEDSDDIGDNMEGRGASAPSRVATESAGGRGRQEFGAAAALRASPPELDQAHLELAPQPHDTIDAPSPGYNSPSDVALSADVAGVGAVAGNAAGGFGSSADTGAALGGGVLDRSDDAFADGNVRGGAVATSGFDDEAEESQADEAPAEDARAQSRARGAVERSPSQAPAAASQAADVMPAPVAARPVPSPSRSSGTPTMGLLRTLYAAGEYERFISESGQLLQTSVAANEEAEVRYFRGLVFVQGTSAVREFEGAVRVAPTSRWGRSAAAQLERLAEAAHPSSSGESEK